MRFISSMLWVTCGQEKGVPAKGIYFPRGNKSFYAKQNYRFYLFDKSWYFPVKHVIYSITKIYKSLVVDRFKCIVLCHSKTRRHMINYEL